MKINSDPKINTPRTHSNFIQNHKNYTKNYVTGRKIPIYLATQFDTFRLVCKIDRGLNARLPETYKILKKEDDTMYIIKIDAFESGARPALQSWNKSVAPEGYALCPDSYFDIFYSTTPAGFVDIEVSDGVVSAMTINQEALDAYIASIPEPVVTAAEKREEAYNTEKIIEWEGSMITVTEAAQLWQYYAAEGNAKADELTVLISAAKETIRQKYPDEA